MTFSYLNISLLRHNTVDTIDILMSTAFYILQHKCMSARQTFGISTLYRFYLVDLSNTNTDDVTKYAISIIVIAG